MRKNKELLLSLLLIACCTIFTSCSKDDEESGSNSQSHIIPGLIESDKLSLPYGYRLTGWEESSIRYEIMYNNDGTLKGLQIKDYYYNSIEYLVSLSPFEISHFGYPLFSDFFFNKKGHITKFHYEVVGTSHDFSITYDSNSRISQINVQSSEELHTKSTWQTSISYKYANDCLVNIKLVSETNEGEHLNGNGGYVPSQVDIQYSYDNAYENLANQFTSQQMIIFEEIVSFYGKEILEGLSLLGYFGNSSKYLPSKVSYTKLYDYNYDGEGNARFYDYEKDINYKFDNYGVVSQDGIFSKYKYSIIRPETTM